MTLKHGFKIEVLSLGDAIEFVKTVEKAPIPIAGPKLTSDFPCNNLKENKVYFVSNSFDIDLDLDLEKNGNLFPYKRFFKIYDFKTDYIHDYLTSVIRLMRLFREGNIHMPYEYFFFYKNEVPTKIMGLRRDASISRISILNFKNSEIKELEQFIHNTKLPFKEKHLQLAFESFELSYHIATLGIPFLLLMMSMESLFNPIGQGELRYRISRNTAVLIGKNKRDSESIWKNMKKLYDKRCDIVHKGESNIVTKENLLLLRDYARRSIKEFYNMGKGKDDILDILNSTGFGDKPWLNKNIEDKNVEY